MGTADDESNRTLFCGNLHEGVTEELLYELFLQAGPLEKVKLVNGKSFSFITFKHEASVPYTIELMTGISLFGRRLNLQFRGRPGGNTMNSGDNNGQYNRSVSAPDMRRQEMMGINAPHGFNPQGEWRQPSPRSRQDHLRYEGRSVAYSNEGGSRSRRDHGQQQAQQQAQPQNMAHNIQAQLSHLRNMQNQGQIPAQMSYVLQQPLMQPWQQQGQRWGYR